MKATEMGVCPGSHHYFYEPTEKARRMYFYTMSIGRYFCDKYYHIRRHVFESFLIFYVREGRGYAEQEGRIITVGKGELVFLDCFRPHAYYTDTYWEIEWIHFDGPLAKEYYKEITAYTFSFRPANPLHCIHSFQKIFADYHEKNRVNEAVHSKRITDLLTELVLIAPTCFPPDNMTTGIEELAAYLAEHACEDMKIEDLAKKFNLSVYHFIRVFKRDTGFTPHEYLIRVRMNLAKFYLKSTSQPLKEIAFRIGYQRESSFCSAFRKFEGMTPGIYRKQLHEDMELHEKVEE